MGDRVTILHLGEGESRDAWKQALADRPWERGTQIKKDGERGVWRATMLGSMVAAKVRPAEPVRTLFAGNEFTKHLAAARLLASAGVETAPVFCLARVGSCDVLITEWLEFPTLLECLGRASADERRKLLCAVGGLIGRQLAADLFNRDHKPSNVIVVSASGLDLALVDIAGVRRPLNATSAGFITYGARMCASVVIEPCGVGIEITEADIQALVSEAAIQASATWGGVTAGDLRDRILARTHEIIAAHGDATPKVNPLGPPAP